MFDSDIAGIAAANRALEICISQNIDIKLAFVPEGKDPCDYLIAAGKEKFEQLIENAVEVFKFKWDKLCTNLKTSGSLADNKASIEEFLQTVASALVSGSVGDIERGLLVNRLSKITGLSSNQINAELNKRYKTAEKTATYNLDNQSNDIDLGGRRSSKDSLKSAESRVSSILLKTKSLPMTLMFPFREAKLIFGALKEDASSTVGQILARTDSLLVSNAIVQLQEIGRDKGTFQASLDGALEAFQLYLSKSENKGNIEIKDETEYLKQLHQDARKHKRRGGLI
jgi:DNA primase